MGVQSEQLSTLKERYDQALKLIEEDSKFDANTTEPYKSHYSAKDILTSIADSIKTHLDTLPDNDPLHLVYQSLLTFIYKDLGKLQVFVEERTAGHKYFTDALAIIESIELCPETVIPRMMVLNELALCHCGDAGDKDLVLNYLHKSREVYDQFKATARVPFTIADLFGYLKGEQDVERSWRLLEKVHTLTLYFLAQSDEKNRAIFYLYCTLRRQLEYDDYEAFDWALNAATFSQFFLSCEGMNTSRHLLASASRILELHQATMLTPEMSEEQRNAKREKFQNCEADVDRCWAMYCFHLLAASKDRLMKDEDREEDPRTAAAAAAAAAENVAGGKKMTPDELAALRAECGELVFASLETQRFEEQVTDQYALVMQDAERVFQFAQRKLNRAREFYRADTHASDYAKIVQDMSALYDTLAFFEEDETRQCKIHKKRVDELEALIELLNPQFFRAICREVRYELGLTYNKMLGIKLDRVGAGNKPDLLAINKINKLSVKSIVHFTAFIESYHKLEVDPRDNIYSRIDPEELPPLFFAYFYLGRLYYKIITDDKRKLLGNITKSLRYYNFFVEACKRFQQFGKMCTAENEVSKEMASLLSKLVQKTLMDLRTQAITDGVAAVEVGAE